MQGIRFRRRVMFFSTTSYTTTKRVRRSQQFQLRRQNMLAVQGKGSVANSSTCPRHDEVATRWSAQCRSTWDIGNRCQIGHSCIPACVPETTCEPASTACTGSCQFWQPVQLLKSRSYTVTRLEIKNGACCCVQDSLERCQRESWNKLEDPLARCCNSPDATGQVL